jgi:hypothetical protein
MDGKRVFIGENDSSGCSEGGGLRELRDRKNNAPKSVRSLDTILTYFAT